MAALSGERLHTNMDKLLPGARSAALLWQGAALAGGLALGAGQVYGGAAPFGLALVIRLPRRPTAWRQRWARWRRG